MIFLVAFNCIVNCIVIEKTGLFSYNESEQYLF